ncbi:MAG: nitrogenase component 1 [Spirochaetaceae bacterium]|nr:nitrogenase component 1 [Spirochaetaceae bacterium]
MNKPILNVNFDSREPQTREVSRRTGFAYGGCTKDMTNCAQKGCLINCDRTFTQGTGCQMMVSTLISFSVKDSVVIMHGPAGCGSSSHIIDFSVRMYGAARGVKMAGARWLTTNLTEAEVIGGGEEKLKQTILDADRQFRPTAIFILMTCTPSIIGDDIDEVVNRTQSEVSATLVPLHCPGFKAKVFSGAYDVVYHGILHKFDFKLRPYVDYYPFNKDDRDYDLKVQQYEYKKSRTVNLYNAWSIGPQDEAEIRRLLEAIGLNVQIFVEFKDPDEWRKITEAALNVSFCHVHDLYFIEFLKQKFNMPYITPSIPIGSSATRKFVMEIAQFFGLEKEADKILVKEEEKLKAALAPIRERVKGKKVLISGGYLRIGTTGLLANEIGMEVVGFRHFNFDSFGNKLFEEIGETIGDISNSISNQPSELVNQVKKLKPDMAISHPGVGIWINKLGIPSITLFAQRFAFFGYRGAYDLARRIDRTLLNTNYAKNLSRNIKLPYKESWYEKSPYHYIIDKGIVKEPEEPVAAV